VDEDEKAAASQIKININVTNTKDKPKAEEVVTRELVNDSHLLDVLFAFVCASSNKQTEPAIQAELLNFHVTSTDLPSRATAGTTDLLPGDNLYRHVTKPGQKA